MRNYSYIHMLGRHGNSFQEKFLCGKKSYASTVDQDTLSHIIIASYTFSDLSAEEHLPPPFVNPLLFIQLPLDSLTIVE